VLSALTALLMSNCRTPATELLLVIDTDAPTERAITLELYAFDGAVPTNELAARTLQLPGPARTLQRSSDGTGSFVAGGSVAIVPGGDRRAGSVTVWLRATIEASATAPPIRMDRAIRASFVRNALGTVRVFLPIRCGDRSVACTSVASDQCTVSIRCREQGATCGDLGECVAAETPVIIASRDGAVDDSGPSVEIDASSGRLDGSADAVADVAVDTAQDAPDGCAPPTTLCEGQCVNTQSSALHCGQCLAQCSAPAPHRAVCASGMCVIECAAGTQLVGRQCVDNALVPRAITPISLGDVTSLRPTFRWTMPAPFDGAMITLCRDRMCTSVIETLRAQGTSARPAAALVPRSVVYWTARGTIAAATSTTASPVWLFHVPAVGAATVDTSFHPHVDLNGDGYDDLIVGAYGADPGGRDTAGAVSVFYGSAAGISPVPRQTYTGLAIADQAGRAVSGAGDVNGDGYGDLVYGASQANAAGMFHGGTATVVHGGPDGAAALPAVVLNGPTADDYFGWSVAAAGDVNLDGYGDIIVGANRADPGRRTNAGLATVYFGSPDGITVANAQGRQGATAGDELGWSVASAGDVNGDGYSDVLMGARQLAPGANAAGLVWLYLGSNTGIPLMPAALYLGAAVGDSFGESVASAGDINNDGYSDIIVGAPQASPGGRMMAGAASVFLGSAMMLSTNAVRVYEGVRAADNFGISVASAGDCNADGFADVIVGASLYDPAGRPNAGSASVYHGSAMGPSALPTRLLEGAQNNDLFGTSCANAGDVNGDGYADVAVGAWLANPSMRADVGSVSIFHGAMAGFATVPNLVLEGVAANDYFGASVAARLGRGSEGRFSRFNASPHGGLVTAMQSWSWPAHSLAAHSHMHERAVWIHTVL
jgi:hypothetical protein